MGESSECIDNWKNRVQKAPKITKRFKNPVVNFTSLYFRMLYLCKVHSPKVMIKSRDIGSYIGEFASFADPSHIFLLKKSKKSWENYLDAVELEKQGPAL